jgi:hypothetical protein
MSLLDKFIAHFDPETKEGRANIFSITWKVGLFMLVLGYILILVFLII